MGRARVAGTNLADSATITASSWSGSAPPSRLQNPHRNRRWRGTNGDSDSVIINWGANQTFDFIGLLGCAGEFNGTLRNLSEVAVKRVRVADNDVTGVSGNVYDSDVDAGTQGIKSAYAALMTYSVTPLVGNTVRLDLSEAGADAILAGRAVVALTDVFTNNFSYGWSFGYADLSRRKKSAGGQTFIDRDDKYRILSLEFGALDPDDRYGFVQEIDQFNGASDDVLFITNPDSTDLTRDTIYGLVDLSVVSQPNLAVFSKPYSIEERL